MPKNTVYGPNGLTIKAYLQNLKLFSNEKSSTMLKAYVLKHLTEKNYNQEIAKNKQTNKNIFKGTDSLEHVFWRQKS